MATAQVAGAAAAGSNSVDMPSAEAGAVERDDVESPSLTSGNALARFEFEPGKSKEGTKVLMVEWEDDDTTRNLDGDWEVRWEDKRHVLPARDHGDAGSTDEEAAINRLYFLLGAGVNLPTTVHLQRGDVSWRTSPLPAIFSPELGATARQAGKKGVLHTIWAKKRLQVLQKEIDNEAKDNIEGIGLEMAVAEKQWIEQNFGVQSRTSANGSLTISTAGLPTLNSPTSPRTPGGGRLMEKLRGLKVDTSDSDSNAAGQHDAHNPLSPEGSDVAISSFSIPDLSSLAAKPPQPPSQQQQQRRMVAQQPPDSIADAQQRQQMGGMGSLNAAFSAPAPSFLNQQSSHADDKDEDDLFALPISPRSPEMTRSPFTFAAQDTGRYLAQERA